MVCAAARDVIGCHNIGSNRVGGNRIMNDTASFMPLARSDVVRAIERRGRPPRIPLVMAKWWGEGLAEAYGSRLDALGRFPDDVAMLWLQPIDVRRMRLSWPVRESTAHDRSDILERWDRLGEFLERLPDPDDDPQFERRARDAERMRDEDRYVLVAWWRLFFERSWGLRGMENILMDYYLEAEMVHRLHDALCGHYERWLRAAADVFHPDGFWTSDDLGSQAQPMMSPDTFDALLFPYFRRVGSTLRELGMHWWLHSCGNITPLLDRLIEAGVTVLHPVQKWAMDEVEVALRFGDRLSFVAGIDVQHMLIEGSPDDVRREVRHLIATFSRPDGGMCIGAGNGILPGTPLENIAAFLDEALSYGGSAD
jgi:uroporphyrinogen decarboxylase